MALPLTRPIGTIFDLQNEKYNSLFEQEKDFVKVECFLDLQCFYRLFFFLFFGYLIFFFFKVVKVGQICNLFLNIIIIKKLSLLFI